LELYYPDLIASLNIYIPLAVKTDNTTCRDTQNAGEYIVVFNILADKILVE